MLLLFLSFTETTRLLIKDCKEDADVSAAATEEEEGAT